MRAIPEFTDRDARLALMDRMHIQSIVNFPTLASLIEVNFMDDPIGTQVLVHTFNQWLFDEWGFDHAGRIFTTPVINLADHRRRGRRARVGARAWGEDRARAAGAGRRLPGAAVAVPGRQRSVLGAGSQEAGIPVMMHASDSGYQSRVGIRHEMSHLSRSGGPVAGGSTAAGGGA